MAAPQAWRQRSNWRGPEQCSSLREEPQGWRLDALRHSDFKWKANIDRRVAQMEAEGVTFHYGAHIGVTQDAQQLVDSFDAVLMTGGAEKSRDFPFRPRTFRHSSAMDFLPQQNRRYQKSRRYNTNSRWRQCDVIGGGDTGSIASAHRTARPLSVTQLEVMPRPPERKQAAGLARLAVEVPTSSSQQEGADRISPLSRNPSP